MTSNLASTPLIACVKLPLQKIQAQTQRPSKNIVDYMSRYTLDYDPGTEPGAYSNYGYVLLSYLVELVTGMAYYDYLSSAILKPGGYDVRQWPTSPGAHFNDPITQESSDSTVIRV